MTMEEIRESVKEIIKFTNDIENKTTIIKNAYEDLDSKHITELNTRCQYRIRNLETAHAYEAAASAEEVENNRRDLTEATALLTKEVSDLEAIRNRVNVEFDNPLFDKTSVGITGRIDEQLKASYDVIRQSKAALENRFSELKSTPIIEEVAPVKEEVAPVIEEVKEETPVVEEVKEETPIENTKDELDSLSEDLAKELAPLEKDKEELQKVYDELNNINQEGTLVTAVEEVAAPALAPIEQKNLDEFLNSVPENGEEDKTVDFPSETVEAPVVEEEVVPAVEEIQSAASVEEGFVKVEQVLDFGEEEVKEEEPTIDNVVNFPAEAFETEGPVRSLAA